MVRVNSIVYGGFICPCAQIAFTENMLAFGKCIAQPQSLFIFDEIGGYVDCGDFFPCFIGDDLRDRAAGSFHLENHVVVIGRDLREFFKFKTAQECINLIHRGIRMNGSKTLFADCERVRQSCIGGAASDEKQYDKEETVDQNSCSTIS